MVDTTSLVRHIGYFLRQFAAELKAEAEKTAFEMQAMVNSQMELTQPQPGEFRNSGKLGIQSAKLATALVPNKPGNIFRVKGGSFNNGFDIDYGIDPDEVPYAPIQEHGGFIKHKGKMPYKLFHLARETGRDEYRIMGAAALKHGGVTIKPKHYWKGGMEMFKKMVLPKKMQRIIAAARRIWIETGI